MIKRNFGIDLLKITAIFMVVILHTNGHGGILFSPSLTYTQENFFYSNYSIVWLIEYLAYCAVNCYALITGYFYWNKKVQYYKLVVFWLQIVFYMVLATLIYSIITATINTTLWFNALFPIMIYQYWYMTAYVGVFLFMPILNAYVQHTPNRSLILHLAILFIIMSVLPFFFSQNGDPFLFHQGYNTFWLIMMYITGGIISKCKIGKNLSKLKCFSYFLLMILLTWGYQMVITYFNTYTQAGINSLKIMQYCAPAIVLAAVFLLLLFKQIRITHPILKKIVLLLSNATLGVYLIHEQPLVRDNFISGYAQEFATYPTLKMVGAILLSSLAIYAICTMIEFIRMQLFKLLNINNCLKSIEIKFTDLLNKS